MLVVMWFFSKKKVAPETKKEKVKEIQVLVHEEKSEENKMYDLVKKARVAFGSAGEKCRYWNKDEYAKIDGSRNLYYFKKDLNETIEFLLNSKIYGKKVVGVAERIEGDLLDIRDGNGERRLDFLSPDEARVLSFNQDILAQIKTIVEKLNVLSGLELEGLLEKKDEKGFFVPKDKDVSIEVRKIMDDVYLGLSGILNNLNDLIELEKKAEELTAAYVNV